MTRNIWRRTAFRSASGDVEVAQDDWTLLRPSGEPLARLYKVTGGPQSGRWYWTVLFRPDGSVGSGGTGFAESGRPRSLRGPHTGNDAGLKRRARAPIAYRVLIFGSGSYNHKLKITRGTRKHRDWRSRHRPGNRCAKPGRDNASRQASERRPIHRRCERCRAAVNSVPDRRID
jgi:hypothetical protein